MGVLTPQNTCFLKICQIKSFGVLSFLLKLNLKLIHKACLLSWKQKWVSLFKQKFWSRKIVFILDGIPLISVLHIASVINQLLKCNQDRVGTSL